MMPADEHYRATKHLKQTGAPLQSPFKELADWVTKSYGVHVLNVIYDRITPNNRPRLSVMLESEEDSLKFRDGRLGTFNKVDQRRVQAQFEKILLEMEQSGYEGTGLWVIFKAFEPAARIEANESVTKEDIQRLKSKLENEDLWEISRSFDTVTFFFYTDAQAKRYEAAGLKEAYAQEYSRLVRSYDEFGYLQKRGVSVCFDSKENFDTNYQSNWFYYYK